MLKYLYIQNYRLFEDFKMDGLGQVNLIAGRNNTGKTALLEALRILESRGDNSVINNIIYERGELEKNNAESFSNLFSRSVLNKNFKEPFLELKIGENLSIIRECEHFSFPTYRKKYEYKFKLTDSVRPPSLINNGLLAPNDGKTPNDKAVFIPFNVDKIQIQDYWKNIALTKDEDDVIKILQIIEPKIDRLNVYHDGAKVRLVDEPNPIPLRNLGEGANRLLVLALALVSAKDKLLLIDEFESGLHYSVQEQLWEIIFEYAKKWNIQVFATTHSMDTVKSFHYISHQEKYKEMGVYFRMQKSRNGEIEAIAYKEDDLQLALEVNLEPRG